MSCAVMALKEMTLDKEVIPEWQTVASDVLVALGMRFPKYITDQLLVRHSLSSHSLSFFMMFLTVRSSSGPALFLTTL